MSHKNDQIVNYTSVTSKAAGWKAWTLFSQIDLRQFLKIDNDEKNIDKRQLVLNL